ncbi:MAG: NUDIX hydrolase [Actinomycetota bacterium]|nr:NUDIX hydrolase [Actinomycetota bacterium]
MTTRSEYPVIDSETVFRGRILSLRRDRVRMSDGTVAAREVVEHLGAVAVAALDGQGRILLVNQYRHPVATRLDELPAGLLDVDGEPALAAAARELSEEADVSASIWHVLLDLYPSPGFSTEAIRIFLARGLSPVPEADRFEREHEEITMTVRRVPLEQAVSAALQGVITNAAAVAGILAAAHGQATGWSELRAADAPWPARPGH